jgi:D-alanyl-D-alanine carboxypeptidase
MPELRAATAAALSHRIATAQAEGRAPSLVGAVVRDGELVFTAGRGSVAGRPPDADTQYRIGSITKTLVAVLVLRLRDEGRLDLADRLDAHLPDSPAGTATIAQLLAHTAGLASETPPPWWERTPGTVRPELRDILGDDPGRHPAGRRFHYSNPGFGLLGALVGRLRGAAWTEVLRAELLEPLGMTRTTPMPAAPHASGYAVHPWADMLLPEPAEDAGLMGPAGQFWSTAADLGRFAAFLLAGHPDVLPAATLEEMREPASGPQDPSWDSSYGLGLQLARMHGLALYGHTGSMPGFVATVWANAEQRVAAVAFANATHGVPIGALAGDLVHLVAEQEPREPEAWAPLPDVDPQLLELTGPWYWGANPFALRLRADRGLELSPLGGAGRAARFRARPDGTWVGLGGYYLGEILSVVRAADGSVSHLDVGSFVFTRRPYDPAAPVPGGVDPAGWRPGAP